MTCRNIRLIFAREIRDQLRDRRTIFMVAILPVLLYPLLGLTFFQVAQFMQEKPSRILVIGAATPLDPPLFADREFSENCLSHPAESDLLELAFLGDEIARPVADARSDAWKSLADEVIRANQYDAVLVLPEDFANRLAQFRRTISTQGMLASLAARAGEGALSEGEPSSLARDDNGSPQALEAQQPVGALVGKLEIPSPQIYYSTAQERSQTAHDRLRRVLDRWSHQVLLANLKAARLPPQVAQPFSLKSTDVAAGTTFYGAALWAKILPLLLVIWALTGAFYPAVDLCAGEKERGTLETLLSSPARRGEIVLGKLAAITVFSMATAVLNLISMGLTGWLTFGHLPQFSAPPIWSVLWLGLALLPTSATFSCLALGIAAFARSTKEGQYYLMPLLFVTLPLVGMPIARGMELNLGTSLVPVMGLVLLLKTLIEGQLQEALRFVVPVAAVTLGACALALRWSVRQFNSEHVLFRESERLDLAAWWQHTLRRRAVPTATLALACGLIILLTRLVFSRLLTYWTVSPNFVQQALLSQVFVILLPTVFMTRLFATDVKATLALHRPLLRHLLGAALLAVVLHPPFHALHQIVLKLYPLDPAVARYLKEMSADIPHWPVLLLVVALLPAVCEELAFRGFILTGLRQKQRPLEAVFLTALFFALSHALLQQSLVAFVAGMVLGGLALRTGSLFPCIVYHALHNGLGLASGAISDAFFHQQPWLSWLATWGEEGFAFRLPAVIAGILLAGMITLWLLAPARKQLSPQPA